eukprot:jgi/Phyca11/21950/fgenesh1_pg.PHYCAscaffold_259_\
MSITKVSTNAELKALTAARGGKLVAGDVVAVHFEFVADNVVAAAVCDTSSVSNAVAFKMTGKKKPEAIKKLLEDPTTNMKKKIAIRPVNYVDLQRLCYLAERSAFQNSTFTRPNDKDQLVAICVVGQNPIDSAVVLHMDALPRSLVLLALRKLLEDSSTVKLSFKPKFASSAASHAMTAARWQHAVVNRGVRAIWFNPGADNQTRSLECFDYNNSGIPGMLTLPSGISSLELQCDLDPVLELLPAEYSDAIVAIDDYHTKLVDVCLDVGRIPYVYIGKKQRVVLSKSNATVTKETIDEVIANLGGEMRIGSDNRAGLDRQLHRISVMRDKTDEVYGLTMRVGRALLNSAMRIGKMAKKRTNTTAPTGLNTSKRAKMLFVLTTKKMELEIY